MTPAEAQDLAWNVGTTLVQFLGYIAVILMALALIGEVRK